MRGARQNQMMKSNMARCAFQKTPHHARLIPQRLVTVQRLIFSIGPFRVDSLFLCARYETGNVNATRVHLTFWHSVRVILIYFSRPTLSHSSRRLYCRKTSRPSLKKSLPAAHEPASWTRATPGVRCKWRPQRRPRVAGYRFFSSLITRWVCLRNQTEKSGIKSNEREEKK